MFIHLNFRLVMGLVGSDWDILDKFILIKFFVPLAPLYIVFDEDFQ
jgi:hypothetical protein